MPVSGWIREEQSYNSPVSHRIGERDSSCARSDPPI